MIDLLAEPDLDWIAAAVDVVERHANKPWRTALDELDDLSRATQPTTARRFSAVVSALQRLTGGRQRNARVARHARGLVLGHPALAPAERLARIEHAALMLGTTPETIELVLWSDLPRERPIQLLGGRPSELEVAAFANVSLLQRALRRAQSVLLRVHGDDPGPIVRAAAQRGLCVVTALHGSRTDDRCDEDRRAHSDRSRSMIAADDEAVNRAMPASYEIHIAGPLSLCHGTGIYGRALGDLVPLLGELRDWSLQIRVELPLASYSTHVLSPVLLPDPPRRLTATPYPIARLARGLQKLQPDLRVHVVPPVLRSGSTLLWPDLAIDDGGRTIYVELVGFWTREYLDAKLAAYAACGADVILCVDATRAAGADKEVPARVLSFSKLVPIDELLARVRPA